MVVEPINNKKIRIRLSNTESVGNNIYKYTSIDKLKETKGKSSTSNYFLTTNNKTGDQLLKLLNNGNKFYYLDIIKTKECQKKELSLMKKLNMEEYFKGNLSAFYTSIDAIDYIKEEYLNLGNAFIKKDTGGRYNMYFNNLDKNVEVFRNSVIAVLSDVIIEVNDDKYIIYPIIKEDIENAGDLNKIIELSKKLEEEYNEEILKEIIIEGYKLLNGKKEE